METIKKVIIERPTLTVAVYFACMFAVAFSVIPF